MMRRSPSFAIAFGVMVLAALGIVGVCAEPAGEDAWAVRRARLVDEELAPRIESEGVLAAMLKVPRHLFVPESVRSHAYENHPLPLFAGQTISQPLIVAMMTELLEPGPESKVLEIGTGSGYQAAVLAELAGEVYSIEILPDLAAFGAANLEATGYGRVHLRVGDGYLGWPEAAPFDGIIVTCAPASVPQPLQDQLAEGGRLVIPLGDRGDQELVVQEKIGGKLVGRSVIPVRFVPMTGIAEEGEPAPAPIGGDLD
jgi:protein-L-isoaspartate(D-aspartate) O-methyltransferase